MTNAINTGQLMAIVTRIERLNEDKAAITEDTKQVYAEAKAMGYDPKILRKVIATLRQDSNKRAEEEAMMDLYMGAIERGTQ